MTIAGMPLILEEGGLSDFGRAPMQETRGNRLPWESVKKISSKIGVLGHNPLLTPSDWMNVSGSLAPYAPIVLTRLPGDLVPGGPALLVDIVCFERANSQPVPLSLLVEALSRSQRSWLLGKLLFRKELAPLRVG